MPKHDKCWLDYCANERMQSVIFLENRKPIVLVVDDEPINIQILASLLSRDYEVKVACDGRTALDIAARMPTPDLILLDVMMPGMDGFTVCQRLKSDPLTKDIPVIFVTAVGGDSEVQGLQLGAVDYIAKPINGAITRLRVKNHIDTLRLRESQQEKLEFMTTMIDNIPLLIMALNVQGQCILMNRAALDTLGYIDVAQAQSDLDVNRLMGLTLADFRRARRCFLNVLHTGQHGCLTLNIGQIEADVGFSPLRNARGQVIGIAYSLLNRG